MKIATFSALALMSWSANAGYFTGNELLALMKSEDGSDRMEAAMYVAGSIDQLSLLSSSTDHEFMKVCFPDGVTMKQSNDLVLKYIDSHPEIRHLGGQFLVFRATKEAWSCPPED